MKKLAFCFLIYDTIHHEELWNIFFKNVDTSKYTIHIHYKTNTPLKYFEAHKLSHCTETKYGDISLVKAQNLLLAEAVKDKEVTHFIFISNSCVPLKSFEYVYNALQEEYSYFNITPQSQCFPRCTRTLKYIPKKYIQKAAQWCILNRKHAILMLSDVSYLRLFSYPQTIPDEHCYITNIFYNNLEHEIITTPNIADGATTFTNWEGMDYKYPSPKKLKNYDSISEEELRYLMNSKSFFGRKFSRECITSFIKKWYIDWIRSS